MKLLADTHILIWALTDSKQKLSKSIVQSLRSSENISFASVVSLWEIGLKYSLGKLQLGMPLEEFFKLIEDSGFRILPMQQSEILKTAQLPFHHSDPFDRLLIAQAITYGFTLISKDAAFKKYDVAIL